MSDVKMMTRHEFLRIVALYISEDPEAAAFMHRHIQQGLNEAFERVNQKSRDMEIVVASLIHLIESPGVKKDRAQWRELVLDKLREWKGKTHLKWDWFTERKVER